MSEYKTCKKCGVEKSIKTFYLLKGKYRKHTCNSCVSKFKTSKNPEKYKLAANKRQKNMRLNRVHVAIYKDCQADDRKKRNSKNDLDYEFIKECIAKGCQYCGDSSLRMTLDRIDNSQNHNKDNVIAACIRCNLFRGSMPYEAWVYFIPTLRQVRELELFGSFMGR